MQILNCNICDSPDYSVLFKAGRAQLNQIVKCTQCGLMYANPRTTEPDHVEIAKFDPDYVQEYLIQNKLPRFRKEALQVRDYNSTRRFLASQRPDKGDLLEVGSGLGFLLSHFRKDGWNTTGVEPDRGLCRYAERTLGMKVIPELLHAAGLADASFDVVLMMHVIEHVPDPTATLQEIHRVLRPNGLFVMETPCYDSLAFKILGRRERSLSCSGHIYFFTSETIERIARKAGFSVVKKVKVGRSMTVGRLLFNVGVVCKSKTIERGLESLSQILRLDRIHLTLNLRDMERVYLQKPS